MIGRNQFAYFSLSHLGDIMLEKLLKPANPCAA